MMSLPFCDFIIPSGSTTLYLFGAVHSTVIIMKFGSFYNNSFHNNNNNIYL